ncbi:MAG: biotin--[acetyl-CoA-carboxylase] ligase [Candidatus Omnitrophica bacterium]|nr:biotin--[acetyl-CoA-carboxylase] ligase [Candidatus Omnitrophota bacterium]
MNPNRSSNLFDPERGENPLSLDEILTHLVTERIGRHLTILEEVDSSNSHLAREAERLPDGAVCVAELQTAGRGRHGRAWTSPPRRNLMFSVVFKESSIPGPIATLIGALSTVQATRGVGDWIALKWPNDLVSESQDDGAVEKKVGGVLSETKTDRAGKPFLILGIGINVNSRLEDFPEEIRERVSTLSFLSGQVWNRNCLLAEILNRIEALWKSTEATGTESIIDEARRNCSTLGKQVRLRIGDQVIEGEAVDLDPMGRLLLRDETGYVYPVELGEVVQARRIT